MQQVIVEKNVYLSGIDTKNTTISQAEETGKKLRVSFAILSSQDNAIKVRKRLLELASAQTSKSPSIHGIVFTMEYPTVYVQSPITI